MQDREFTRPAGVSGDARTESTPGSSDLPIGRVMAKADLTKRFLAALIDAVLAFVVSIVPVIGGLIAAAYMLLRDGLELDFMDGRSIGKKVMKLRPVRLDGQPMDLVASAKRNWMFALGGITSLLLFIPVLGWLLMIPVALAGLALGIIEVVLVITDSDGRRLGDKIAGSQVVEVDS
jgi:uncharacterized RDD family membrane protein YckC